jgi:hypothetical protein
MDHPPPQKKEGRVGCPPDVIWTEQYEKGEENKRRSWENVKKNEGEDRQSANRRQVLKIKRANTQVLGKKNGEISA